VSTISSGVGIDNATSLADVATTLGDVLDAETPGVTQSTWLAALSAVDLLADIRRQHPSTPIHQEELRVSENTWLTRYGAAIAFSRLTTLRLKKRADFETV